MSETPTAGEFDLLEKLALSLLAHPGNPSESKPRLFPGKIPENFPLEVPLPEQCHVIGTLARSATQVEIVLESDLTQEDIFSFYRTQLTSLGWQEPEDTKSHPVGGFLHSDFGPHTNLIFCQGSGGAGLTLNILQQENAATNVRLHIHLGHEMNPCQQTRIRRYILHRRMYEIIPTLAPPKGAQQYGGEGGHSDHDAHTTATLKSNLALDALAKHYADQLSQAGWIQTDAGTSSPLAWHSWHFTSEDQEPWSGLFFILKTPEKPDDYFLHIRATWTKPESDQKFTSWFSSSSTFNTH